MANDGAGGSAGGTGSPAAGGTPPPSGGTPPAGGAPSDWTSSLNDELKGYVQNKGFKDPAAVVDSYRNFEKLQGVPQERIVKLPEKFEGDEARSVFQRLGMPKEAKDYNIAIPKELGDEKLTEWIKNAAYKNNMTTRQIEGFVKDWAETAALEAKAKSDAAAEITKVAQDNLKKDWGANYDNNINIAKAAAVTFKFDQAKIDALESALGFDGVMKHLHDLGLSTGEAKFIDGSKAAGDPGPEQARAKIKELEGDSSWVKRYLAGEAPEKAQMERLQKIAYAGTYNL